MDTNCKEKTFQHSNRKINAKHIVCDPEYNRPVSKSEVKDIICNFNPNILDPLKVSLRNNKYYIFDGNHRLVALTEMNNGNRDFMVDCIVFEGMTKEDEARMFAIQDGNSRKVKRLEQVKALYVAKEESVIAFRKTVESAGAKCSFVATNNPYHIKCYDTAYKLFLDYGDKHLYDVIDIIIKSWNGHPDSLRKEIILGISILLRTYPEIDKKWLCERLGQVGSTTPKEIIQNGKDDKTFSGNKRYAIQIAKIYNKRKTVKNQLDLGKLI